MDSQPTDSAAGPGKAASKSATGEPGTVIDSAFGDVLDSWREWWNGSVIGTVNQQAVIEKRRAECGLTARYLFMTAMSAGIAVLGLLLSSPAVVIGAMLLSPLMDPIIGLGMALAIGDFAWTRQSAKSLLIGTIMAIALCAFIVFLSPLQEITPEIAARTRPNLFDLLVALFSGLAGAYAMIRGREGTVVGVAIATALMPPLAVIGFGLATLNWTVFLGATLLYVTNLVTITITALLMSKLYGFRTSMTEKHTRFQFVVILAVFVALIVPLGISLDSIRHEAQTQRAVRSALADVFEGDARLSNVEFNWETTPIQVDATVLTPELRANAEGLAARMVERRTGTPVNISLTQFQVGTGEQAVEQAQLAAARAKEEANAQRAAALAERLALIAGVENEDVLVDRERRQAIVTAKPLEGATLTAYRELEGRIAATEPSWSIKLRPPARELPEIALEDGEPTEAGQAAIALIEWAQNRVTAPVVLTGVEAEVTPIAAALAEKGITVRTEPRGGRGGTVTAAWGVPE